MDMSGEYRIPAPRERVWAALNDPDILRQAIPGCDELIKHSDTELEAKVTAKVGPVKARFGGNVRLENMNPPESYSITGEGKGGAAGFAKGGADVHLREDGADTILTYNAKAEVGGKLAQIGSRLIQGTARKMADEFFGTFSRLVTEAHAAATPPPAPPAAPPPGTVEATPPPPPPAEPAPPPLATPEVTPAPETAPAPEAAPPPPVAPVPPPPRPPVAGSGVASGETAGKGGLAALGKPVYIAIAVVVLILLFLLLT